MFDIATSILKKRFLTFHNFFWLFFIFICVLLSDEFLESIGGITLENTSWDYIFDGFQILIIGIAIYLFLNYIEKHARDSFIKDSFLRAVIENMDEGVAVCDKDGNLVFLNDIASQRIINKKFTKFPIPYGQWSILEIYESEGKAQMNHDELPLLRALRGEKVTNQKLVTKQSGTSMQFVSINGKQIKGKSGEVLGALIVIHDITEQKQLEEKIKYMAFHDKLTGLPNRRLFKDKITHFLEVKQNSDIDLLAIMFLDLDGFKAINDNFGHDVGDLLLKEVSHRITACLRKTDFASRIGGDEFTVLLTEIKTEDEAKTIANSIIEAVGSPYNIQGSRLKVTISIGITFAPNHGIDTKTLMKNADLAMYTSKKNGKNQYFVFSDK